MNENKGNSLNHQQSIYDAAYSASTKAGEAIPFPDHKIEYLHLLKGKRIVSIGGGTGSDIAHLASTNDVHIVDYSQGAAEAARLFGIRHHVLDLNQPQAALPFEAESIDVLVLKDVLEHLMEPRRVMDEMKRVLKSDGYMVISLPNHLNLWGRVRILFGGNLVWRGILHDHRKEFDEWNYMHLRFFTWSGVKRFLASCSLEIERKFFDFGPFGHYFSVPMYAEHLSLKEKRGLLTSKGRIFLKVGYPIYRALELLFPSTLRGLVCSLSPGLMTSCFYLHVRKRGAGA